MNTKRMNDPQELSDLTAAKLVPNRKGNTPIVRGDFKSMTYFETRKSSPARFVIYRFKGVFTKEDVMEVRMVYNLEGKIDGFWIKPWLNSMQ